MRSTRIVKAVYRDQVYDGESPIGPFHEDFEVTSWEPTESDSEPVNGFQLMVGFPINRIDHIEIGFGVHHTSVCEDHVVLLRGKWQGHGE